MSKESSERRKDTSKKIKEKEKEGEGEGGEKLKKHDGDEIGVNNREYRRVVNYL